MPKRTSSDSLENMAVFLDLTVASQIFLSDDGQLFFDCGVGASRKGFVQPGVVERELFQSHWKLVGDSISRAFVSTFYFSLTSHKWDYLWDSV